MMGRGRSSWVMLEWVWMTREVQSCWNCRSWVIVVARWWRYAGCEEHWEADVETFKTSSMADGGGSSVVAEGAMIWGRARLNFLY